MFAEINDSKIFRKGMVMGMRRAVLLLMVFCLIGGTSAAVPLKMNYQGRLTDDSGAPLTGDYNMVFKVYDVASGGSALWTETQTNVPVSNGMFNVVLGSVTTLDADDFADGGDRWLGITVGGDSEMAPRRRITSVAYAFNAAKFDGHDWSEVPSGSDYVAKAGDTMTGNLTVEGVITSNPADGGDPIFSLVTTGTNQYGFEVGTLDLTGAGYGKYPYFIPKTNGTVSNLSVFGPILVGDSYPAGGGIGQAIGFLNETTLANMLIQADWDYDGEGNNRMSINDEVYINAPLTVDTGNINTINLNGGAKISEEWDGGGNDIKIFSRNADNYLFGRGSGWIWRATGTNFIDSAQSGADALLQAFRGGSGGDEGKFSIRNDRNISITDFEAQKELMGCRRALTAGKQAAQTADAYLTIGIGGTLVMSSTVGYVQNRPGSIVGYAINLNVGAQTTAGDVTYQIRKNDVTVWSKTISINGTGRYTAYDTTARGTYTFAAGDTIQIYVDFVDFEGTISNQIMEVEIVVDT